MKLSQQDQSLRECWDLIKLAHETHEKKKLMRKILSTTTTTNL